MAEAYVVGMVVPHEQPEERDDASDDIEALFGDSSNGDASMREATHREQVTRQFMAVEWEALSAMLVVRANAARVAALVAAQEEAARAAEEASAVAAQEKAARTAAWAEKLAEEAAVAARELARDRCRWDKDMATATCPRNPRAHERVPPPQELGPCLPDRRRGLKHRRRRLGRRPHVGGDCGTRTATWRQQVGVG
jgi:hypothetical protein